MMFSGTCWSLLNSDMCASRVANQTCRSRQTNAFWRGPELVCSNSHHILPTVSCCWTAQCPHGLGNGTESRPVQKSLRLHQSTAVHVGGSKIVLLLWMPARIPSKCSSVSSILPTQAPLPTRFDSARKTITQLVIHVLTERADAAIIRLAKDPPEGRASIASSVVPGHQPSNVTDQPHNCGMFHQKTAANSRLQNQLVRHKDSTVNLKARFDWSQTLMTEGRAFALTSDLCASSPSACSTTKVCLHFSNVCATAATVSTDESFVDCIAIAPVKRS